MDVKRSQELVLWLVRGVSQVQGAFVFCATVLGCSWCFLVSRHGAVVTFKRYSLLNEEVELLSLDLLHLSPKRKKILFILKSVTDRVVGCNFFYSYISLAHIWMVVFHNIDFIVC